MRRCALQQTPIPPVSRPDHARFVARIPVPLPLRAVRALLQPPPALAGPLRRGRERVLARDHYLCRVCLSPAPLVVHHRRPSNRPSSLITLCRACHTRLHRLGAIDRWVPEPLSDLWAEQHPRSPRQLQLPGAFLR